MELGSIMRSKVLVVTNNPSVTLAEQDIFVEGGLLAVMQAARDLVHKGHSLISHPLSGSVKPNESPYKSIVLAARSSSQVDFSSLSVIEGCWETSMRMLRESPLPNYSARVLTDFQLIDSLLLQTALESIPLNL